MRASVKAALVAIASISSFTVVGVGAPAPVVSAAAGVGAYTPLAPARIHDTRTAGGRIGAGQTRAFAVANRGGVPLLGVSAVVVNVTVVSPTNGGFLTVWPSGPRPTASSINFVAGQTLANLVTVPLSGTGSINVYNAVGSTHVLIDVEGYYASSGATAGNPSGFYKSVVPQRMYDTRVNNNNGFGKPRPADQLRVWADYGPTVNPHIKALAVNITAISPDGPGFLTAWNNIRAQVPSTSTINYSTGRNAANMAIVPVAPCEACGTNVLPTIAVRVGGQGRVHIAIDIVGYYDDGTLSGTWAFKPRAAPVRLVDTRSDTGTTELGPNDTNIVDATSIVTATAEALITNTTAVRPTTTTYLTLFKNGTTRPVTSNLNASTGVVVANHTITPIDTTDAFAIYNAVGTTDVLVDVVGTLENRGALQGPAASGLADPGGASSRS